MISVDFEGSTHKHSKWSQYTQQAWQSYCNRHGLKFVVIDKVDEDIHHPKWMKLRLFKYAGQYMGPQDRLLYVDSDTMPKWDAPDFFKETEQFIKTAEDLDDEFEDEFEEDEFYDDEFDYEYYEEPDEYEFIENPLLVVQDNHNLRWINNSIEKYSKLFQPADIALFQYGHYFNSGVIGLSRNHIELLDALEEWYKDNYQALSQWSVPHTGIDQTPLNIMAQSTLENISALPHKWNQHSILNYELHQHNFQQGDKTPYFVKYGYIWHFNGMSIERRHQYIETLWKTYGDKYQ